MTSTQFYILLAAVVLITIAASVFGVLYFTKTETVIPNPVYIPGEKIIEKHYYTKEIIKSEPATIVDNIAAMTLDSLLVFDKDSLMFSADIKYKISDSTFHNKFEFDLIQHKEFQIDTLKQFVPVPFERDLLFYEKPYFNFGLGIFLSLLLFLTGALL